MVKVGLKQYTIIQNFQKWSNMVKYDLIWSYMVQMLSLRSSKWIRHNKDSWSSLLSSLTLLYVVQVVLERGSSKENLLITHWENTTLLHNVRKHIVKPWNTWEYHASLNINLNLSLQVEYQIEYRRINHLDFKFKIQVRNPLRSRRKVTMERTHLKCANFKCANGILLLLFYSI